MRAMVQRSPRGGPAGTAGKGATFAEGSAGMAQRSSRWLGGHFLEHRPRPEIPSQPALPGNPSDPDNEW
jgi:hypothetical protein